MSAVIESGGKQYYVKKGDVIKTSDLSIKTGEEVTFINKLVLDNDTEKKTSDSKHSSPHLSQVKARVLEHIKCKKIIVFKKKRRHNYRRKKGHRQMLSVLRIIEIGEK